MEYINIGLFIPRNIINLDAKHLPIVSILFTYISYSYFHSYSKNRKDNSELKFR